MRILLAEDEKDMNRVISRRLNLVKPFAFEELMARLRVMVRRKGVRQECVYTCGDLTVDSVRHHVLRS